MKEQFRIFLESSQQFLNEIAVALPKIVGALLILLIGWIIARLIKKAIVKLLYVVKIDKLADKVGIEQFLKEGGLKKSSVDMLGSLFYWIIMLTVILAVFNSLQLTSAQQLFNSIILFIPNIIVALIILLFGLYAAKFVATLLSSSLKNMKDKTADLIEKVAYYSIVIFTIFLVLGQLRIAQDIITNAFILLFGAFCLAFGIAFGLGGKDAAAEILEDLKNKRKEK
ncbi:MAG: hypothetical protein CSA96_06875 [Bacteroidetes bacterium]|nr:MAG: hypothetical protein CSA96_06875 [Bacteroidota bacterium]